MELRAFGRTGVKVSPLCLGAMMFGAWGNRDHDDSIDIIHAALDAGINFIDTADVYSGGESEEIVGKALQGRRDDVVLATKVHAPMGDGPEHERQLAPLDHARVRGQPAPPRHRLHRPLPDAPARPRHRHRRDARRAVRPRAPGQGALHRQLDVSRVGDRRGAVGRRSAATGSASCASSRRTRSSSAASRPTCCRPAQRYGMGVIPWSPLGRRMALGHVAQGRRRPHQPTRACRMPDRYDLSQPENQRKLDAADALAHAGRRGRHHARAPGGRVGDQQPGGHVGDHRAAHDGAAHDPARRRRRHARRRSARPHRRDRAAGHRRSTRPTRATSRRWSPTRALAGARADYDVGACARSRRRRDPRCRRRVRTSCRSTQTCSIGGVPRNVPPGRHTPSTRMPASWPVPSQQRFWWSCQVVSSPAMSGTSSMVLPGSRMYIAETTVSCRRR